MEGVDVILWKCTIERNGLELRFILWEEWSATICDEDLKMFRLTITEPPLLLEQSRKSRTPSNVDV